MNEPIATSRQRKLYAAGLPVSCYGKLPFYQDFIRIDGGTEGLRDFSAWVDRAFGMRWDDLDGRGETVDQPVRVLYAVPRNGSIVCGSLRDSSDSGGLRQFPFAAFTEISIRSLDPSLPGFVIGILPVWKALERWMEEATCVSSITEFYDAVRGRLIFPELIEGDPTQSPGSVLVSEFARSLDQDHLGTSLPGLMFHLAQTILIQKKKEPRDRMTQAYRFPYAPSIPIGLQAGAWIGLLVRSFSKLPALPSLMLPRDSLQERPAFSILFRPVEFRDVRLLSSRADQATRIFDLTTEQSKRPSPPPEFADRLRKDLLDGEATLADLTRYKLPKVKLSETFAEDA